MISQMLRKFLIVCSFIALLFPSYLYGQDLSAEEIERLEIIRERLIQEGYLGPQKLELAYSGHTDPIIVNSEYLNRSTSVATSGSRDTFFRPDGRRMYIVGRVSGNILQYNLSTPWDINDSSLQGELDISPEMGSAVQPAPAPHGIHIRPDTGRTLWVFNRSEIWEYTLSSAWDITTAVQTGYKDLSSDIVRGHAIDFRPNGRRLYIDDRELEVVYQYDLSTAWDISTISKNYVLDISQYQQEVRGIQLNADGNRMYLLDTEKNEIMEFHLPNNFDIRNANRIGTFNVNSQASDPRGISFNSDFDGFYITDSTIDRVYQYRIFIADPSESGVSADRSKVIADGSATSRITVVARDKNGERLQGITVRLTSSNTSATINTVNRNTNSNGQARFDVSSSSEGTVTFTASASGNIINETVSVTFTSVSASESQVVSNREKVIANGTAVSRVTVTAKDADGDVLEGVRINLTSNSSSASITNVRRDTDSNGEALFEVSNNVIEPVIFTARGMNTTISQTVTVRFAGVDPGESNVLSSRQKVLANGDATGRIIVIARDEDGDLLEGVRISLDANSSNALVSAINRDTDNNGEAVFEVRNQVAESVRFTARSMGQTITQTQTVRFVTVAPELSSASVTPPNVQANGLEQSRILVTIKDDDGEALEGARVLLQSLNGNSEILNNEIISDQEGEAEFRVTNTVSEFVDYRIVAEGLELAETVRVGFIPVAPVVLSASGVQQRQFTANWEMVSGAERYLIDVSADSSFENIITIYDSFDAGNSTSLTIENGIEPGKRYLYRVRAAISDLIGANSEPAQAFTFPDTPQTTAASAQNALVFNANWAAAEGAENYRLDVATDAGFESYVAGYRDLNVGNQTTVTIEGLEPGVNYYYRVRSEAGPRISQNSNVTQARTLAISQEASVVESAQLRVLANGQQSNNVEITVKSEDGQPLRGLDVVLTPQELNPEITASNAVTDNDGKARFGVTSDQSGKVTFEVTARGINVGELTIEFIRNDGVLVLGNNFPNPFTAQTYIPVTVPRSMEVRIVAYNSVGMPVRTIVDETVETGYYEFRFDASGLASGVYFYRLFADGEIKTEKMVLVN